MSPHGDRQRSEGEPAASPRLRWGVVGLGHMAARFARSIAASERCELQAVASRDPRRVAAFARDHGAIAHATYQDVFDDPDVDAVYIATVHSAHRELSERASRAGKAVLVEKPMSTDAGSVRSMIGVAERNAAYLLEGYMYRFHPRTRLILDLLRDGAVGEVLAVEASYGFVRDPSRSDRLMDPALGGGAILDVGGYPVSFARLIAATASGQATAEPSEISSVGTVGSTGVDVWAVANLRFDSGMVAVVTAAIDAVASNDVRIRGSRGELIVEDPWVPRADATPTVRLARVGHAPMVLAAPNVDQHAAEADAVARDRGKLESPEMTWADSLGNAIVLESWRRAVLEHGAR